MVRKTCKPGSPCTILMIEDDLMITTLLAQQVQLSEPGCFMIETAGSLAEAVPKLSGLRYDAVLLDLGLPDSEGIATLHVTQKLVKGQIPIVVLSGSIDTETEWNAFDLDAAEYVSKPFNAARLLIRIRHAILRHRRWLKRQKELQQEVEILRSVEQVITGEPQTQLHKAAEAIWQVASSMRVAGS